MYCKIGQKEWDHFVSVVLFAYRTKKHKTTEYTPFYLMYGQQATLPVELKIPGKNEVTTENLLLNRLYQLIDQLENVHHEVVDRVSHKQEAQKNQHDQAGISKKLKIGDKVLVKRT